MRVAVIFSLGLFCADLYAEPIQLAPQDNTPSNSKEDFKYPPATEPISNKRNEVIGPLYPSGNSKPVAYESTQVFSPNDTAPGKMSREDIEKYARGCKKKIADLWGGKGSLSRGKQPYFHGDVIRAFEACEVFVETAKSLAKADAAQRKWEQYFTQAQIKLSNISNN